MAGGMTQDVSMTTTVKLFTEGRSQAVRISEA